MMTQSTTIAIVTPAFRAEDTLATTVASVLAQTHSDWQHWIVADDGHDYAGFLDEKGLRDERQVFLTSGGIGTGASRTRNVALERIEAPFVAILDADDRLKPQKLERVMAAFGTHAIVTTALDVMTMDFTHLRFVGDGPDRELTPGEHKWVSLSMDSMVCWDRRRTDARYDPGLSNMTDLELLLQLYRKVPASFHLGAPLHDYIKRDGSMSNGKDVAAGMIASKTEILRRLECGFYRLSAVDVAGAARFLRVSLAAETAYGAALAEQPGLLFEDHLEPMLKAARA
jgi:glycosyltransferase involved in cell wall biosynthesis